jgi:hypothetical protein
MACGEDAPDYSSSGRIINELLWNAAFHASQGRLIEGCSLRDFVQFRHWPNLTRLPVTPNTARICALLTRRRTVIAMVHQHLAINNEEVCQIYSAAYCAGISNAINSALAKFKIGADDPRLAPERKHSLFRSLFGKIAGL